MLHRNSSRKLRDPEKRGREVVRRRIVADVPAGTVARFRGFWGVLGSWTGKGGRRFDRWEGGPIQLWPYDEIEALERLERSVQQNGRPQKRSTS